MDKQQQYSAPEVEMFEARVETGFQGSIGGGSEIVTPIVDDPTTPPGGWGPANSPLAGGGQDMINYRYN